MTSRIPVTTSSISPMSGRRSSKAENSLPQNSTRSSQEGWYRNSLDANSTRNSLDEKKSPVSNTASLPPQDHGRGAWFVLIAAFIIEAVLWSIPQTFGVFQDYYLDSPGSPFKGDSRIILVGVLAAGIPDIGAPLMTWLVSRYPRHRIAMMWPGWFICIGGLIAASFAPTMPILIVTQGLAYGIGQLIVFYPMLSLVNEWWNLKLGLAYGILDCSTGLTGAPLPFLVSYLLRTYGSVWTLRILTIGVGTLTLPALIMVRGRLPAQNLPVHPALQRLPFLRNPLFWIYFMATFLQGLGWFTPLMFLPTFVTDLGFSIFPATSSPAAALAGSEDTASLLLALLSLASIPGSLITGHLSDKGGSLSLPLLAILCTATSAFSVFMFWGFTRTLYFLVPFAVIFSLFGSGWEVLWGRMSLAVNPPPRPTSPSSDSGPMQAYALLSLGRGISNVVSGLVGAKLITIGGDVIEYEFGAGRYLPLILWTGIAIGAAALLLFAWWVLPRSVTERFDAGIARGEEFEAVSVGSSARSRANTTGEKGHGVVKESGSSSANGQTVRSRRFGGAGGARMRPTDIDTEVCQPGVYGR